MADIIVTTAAELAAIVEKAVREALARQAAPSAEVFTLAQAAEYVRLHPDTLSRVARKEGLGHRVGSHWRFRRSELDTWLDSRRAA